MNKRTNMKLKDSLRITYFILINIHKINPLDDKDIEIINECKELEKPTEFDVQRFLDHKETHGPHAHCFAACVYEKIGVIKNGTIQLDVLKAKILKEHKVNQKAKDPINDIISECEVVAHSERCEQASQLKGCIEISSLLNGKFVSDHGIFV